MKNKKFIFFGVVLSFFLIATLLIFYDDNQYSLVSKINLKSSGDLDLSSNPISIIGNSGWKTAGFSGLGTPDDPYVIENLIIDGNGIGNCIYIENSDVYFIIRNCTLHNSGEEYTNAGIFLWNTANGRITNNTCYNNEMGIVCWNGCHNNTVSKNIVEYNNEGIRFDSCLLGAYDNKIFENILRFNYGGIHIDGENNIITKNHALANIDYGIAVTDGTNNLVTENIVENNDRGIFLAFSDNNNISDNIARFNNGGGIGLHISHQNNFSNNFLYSNERGIGLWMSNLNIIVNNKMYGNTIWGISLSQDSNNNLIYLNNFTENNHNGLSQDLNNQWDNGAIGNYWDDYDGVDLDENGIGDTPYINNGITDNFPIMDYILCLNTPPIAEAGPDQVVDECITVTFDASGSSDPDDDPLLFRWDFNNDGSWDTDWDSSPFSEYTWFDDYTGQVIVEVSDGKVEMTDETTVTVNNVAPIVSINDVVQPFPEFILPSDVIEFYGSFFDPGYDTHDITWDFGDNTIVYNTLTPTHAYSEAGIYTITLYVEDDDGGIGSASVIITVESPEEAAEEIIGDVEVLDLPGESEQSLVLKLRVAQSAIENDRTNIAIFQFNAFIRQVEAMRGKKLTNEEADALISAAQWIIDNLVNNGS